MSQDVSALHKFVLNHLKSINSASIVEQYNTNTHYIVYYDGIDAVCIEKDFIVYSNNHTFHFLHLYNFIYMLSYCIAMPIDIVLFHQYSISTFEYLIKSCLTEINMYQTSASKRKAQCLAVLSAITELDNDKIAIKLAKQQFKRYNELFTFEQSCSSKNYETLTQLIDVDIDQLLDTQIKKHKQEIRNTASAAALEFERKDLTKDLFTLDCFYNLILAAQTQYKAQKLQ